jgi:hypothetical protein
MAQIPACVVAARHDREPQDYLFMAQFFPPSVAFCLNDMKETVYMHRQNEAE